MRPVGKKDYYEKNADTHNFNKQLIFHDFL